MNKKIYVSTEFVPERNRKNITAGKRYEVLEVGLDCKGKPDSGLIITDKGVCIFLMFNNSAHLDGESWTVHYE